MRRNSIVQMPLLRYLIVKDHVVRETACQVTSPNVSNELYSPPAFCQRPEKIIFNFSFRLQRPDRPRKAYPLSCQRDEKFPPRPIKTWDSIPEVGRLSKGMGENF